MKGFTIFLFSSALFCMLIASTAVDTIVANQNIRDNDTIVSAGGIFELGIFTPRNSKNRYLGVWYKKISTGTVVWVANRDIPLNNASSILRFNYEGNLVLLNNTNGIVWSSNSSRSTVNPVAQLLDTGNLVIRAENDSNPDNFFWQSFDYPCDNFLPGMKYGLNMETGIDRYLTSWKSNDDPSPGDYTNRVVPDGYPQLLLRNNSTVLFRSGPWNGLRYSGMPNLEPNSIYTYEFVFNQREIYYKYELINNSVFTRMTLNPRGDLQRFMWIDRTQSWLVYLTAQMDDCDRYGLCGAYGSCNINDSPPCGCLDGFEPKFQELWEVADWSHGCVREIELDCGNGDGFVRHSGVKLPDTRGSWFNESMNLEECERVCLENCSCTAYANTDIRRGGS